MKKAIIFIVLAIVLTTGCTIPGTDKQIHGLDAFCKGQTEITCKTMPDCVWENNQCIKKEGV